MRPVRVAVVAMPVAKRGPVTLLEPVESDGLRLFDVRTAITLRAADIKSQYSLVWRYPGKEEKRFFCSRQQNQNFIAEKTRKMYSTSKPSISAILQA